MFKAKHARLIALIAVLAILFSIMPTSNVAYAHSTNGAEHGHRPTHTGSPDDQGQNKDNGYHGHHKPTPSPSPTPTHTPRPTCTPTTEPTHTPAPTQTPTVAPTATPTLRPTQSPTPVPTVTPTPTQTQTVAPTATATPAPTTTPVPIPTARPTVAPTATQSPTPASVTKPAHNHKPIELWAAVNNAGYGWAQREGIYAPLNLGMVTQNDNCIVLTYAFVPCHAASIEVTLDPVLMAQGYVVAADVGLTNINIFVFRDGKIVNPKDIVNGTVWVAGNFFVE